MAKSLGSSTATTVSTYNKEFAKKEIGADERMNYKTQSLSMLCRRTMMMFFDPVGGETYTRSFKVLEGSGGIIVYFLEKPNREILDPIAINAVDQFTKVNRELLTRPAA